MSKIMATTTPPEQSRTFAERVRFLFTEFPKQVRQEAAKVTWPSRKETLITTAMVFVMSIAAAIFFVLVDSILNFGVSRILGFGG